MLKILLSLLQIQNLIFSKILISTDDDAVAQRHALHAGAEFADHAHAVGHRDQRQRAGVLAVAAVEHDEPVDVAACVGATWIGGGVAGTIELLKRSLCDGGMLLIGEPFWRQLPPSDAVAQGCQAHAVSDFLTLPQLLASFAELGHDVVEMVLADQDGWDRYEAAKWLTMRRWLEANPGDDMAAEVQAQLHSEPVRYATYTREYLGWGVFALMAR